MDWKLKSKKRMCKNVKFIVRATLNGHERATTFYFVFQAHLRTGALHSTKRKKSKKSRTILHTFPFFESL